MNNFSLNEDKDNLKNVLNVLFGILITGAIVAGLLTNYKQETLICSKFQDICYIEKVNLVNQKTRKTLVKFSQIDRVGFLRQRVKGNRYAIGYSSYLLTFILKNNNPVVIFSADYYEKSELEKDIKILNYQMTNSIDKIILNRDI